MQELTPNSMNDTLVELKLGKYEGTMQYFKISENDVISAVLSEWDISKLNDWKGPFLNENENENNINWEQYEMECYKFADLNKHSINHAFWELMLNELWTYSKELSTEKFPNPSDVQLRDTLNKCLSVCCLLDILKGTIVANDKFKNESKKQSLLLKETITNNIHLQSIINENIGTKLDIERWKKTEDTKKMYQHCGKTIQKEAMKSGKEFVKLYKIYKLNKHKEKKRKQKAKQEAERKVKEEEATKIKQETEKEKEKEEEAKAKEEEQQPQQVSKEIEPENKKEPTNPTDDTVIDAPISTNGPNLMDGTNNNPDINDDIKNEENRNDVTEIKQDDKREIDEKEVVDNGDELKQEIQNDVSQNTDSKSAESKSYFMFMAIVVALLVIILGYLFKK